MSRIPCSGNESDGEDFFTCSISSDDLCCTIKDLSEIRRLDSSWAEGEYADPLGSSTRPADLDPDGSLLLGCSMTDSQTHTPYPWTLPEDCGDASVAACMRELVLATADARLASAHSEDAASKLSHPALCAALSCGPLASTTSHPTASVPLSPLQASMPRVARFEEYRTWLHEDSEEMSRNVLLSPPVPPISKPTGVSIFSGRRAVPALGSILLNNHNINTAKVAARRGSQPSENALTDNSANVARAPMPPEEAKIDNLSFVRGASSGFTEKSSSLTAAVFTPALTCEGSPTADCPNDSRRFSLHSVRERQDSCAIEFALPPLVLPSAQVSGRSLENSVSLKSPTPAAHVGLTSMFSSPSNAALGSAHRPGGERRHNASVRTPGLFSRLFTPKRFTDSDFSVRQTVVCGAGSPRTRGRCGSESAPVLPGLSGSPRGSQRLHDLSADASSSTAMSPVASPPVTARRKSKN